MRSVFAICAVSVLMQSVSSNSYGQDFNFSKITTVQPKKMGPSWDSYETILQDCFKSHERVTQTLETCEATSRAAAPHWYEGPEAAWFLFSAGAVLGFFVGSKLQSSSWVLR